MPTTEYRLDLCGRDVTSTVGRAGGWIVDHAMAGWRVTVCIPEGTDARALEVLGADVGPCEKAGPGHHAVHEVSGAASGPGREHVCHQLSAAARAFKANALLAAGLQRAPVDLEDFWLLERREAGRAGPPS